MILAVSIVFYPGCVLRPSWESAALHRAPSNEAVAPSELRPIIINLNISICLERRQNSLLEIVYLLMLY